MNSRFIPEHDQAIKLQNFGPRFVKSSQSSFNLRSQGSYLARSYLIDTVRFPTKLQQSKRLILHHMYLDSKISLKLFYLYLSGMTTTTVCDLRKRGVQYGSNVYNKIF